MDSDGGARSEAPVPGPPRARRRLPAVLLASVLVVVAARSAAAGAGDGGTAGSAPVAGSVPAPAAPDPAPLVARSRDWVIANLAAHLTGGGAAGDRVARPPTGGGPDWNRVASMSYPLASLVRRAGDGRARAGLEPVVRALASLDPHRTACADAVNAALTAGFLFEAGITVPVRESLRQRVAACETGRSPFDIVNSLFYRCRYAEEGRSAAVRGALARVVAAQQPDGSFAPLDMPEPYAYYLSSHAVISLHACRRAADDGHDSGHDSGGDEEASRSSAAAGPPADVASLPAHTLDRALERGRTWLARGLTGLNLAGFLDGLAESLIFLAWTGPMPNDVAPHMARLRARARADGGLCFVDRPGCQAHWHATSLLVELESLALDRTWPASASP